MSEVDAVIAEIMSGSIDGAQDPSVAMIPESTPVEVVNGVGVTEPDHALVARRAEQARVVEARKEKAQKALVEKANRKTYYNKPVEGKVDLDVSGTPFTDGTKVYPRGYVMLTLSNYQKIPVYLDEFDRLAEFFHSVKSEDFRNAAIAGGLVVRQQKGGAAQ